MTRDVLPSVPILDQGNIGLIDAKLVGYRLESAPVRKQLKYLSDTIFGQFCVAVVTALRGCGPALITAVSEVIRLRANEDMCRVAARGVIASMAHNHAVGDKSICQLPRNSVREHVGSFHINLAIAVGAPRSLPLPTSIWTTRCVDLIPEPLNVFWCKLGMHVKITPSCDTPRGITSTAGAFRASIIPRSEAI